MRPFGNPGREPAFTTIGEIGALVRLAEITALSLTEQLLERIERFQPQLNAFITVSADEALEQATEADRELAAGRDRGPLHGIPIAIKDLISTRGVRTSAGTLFLRDWVPRKDAEVVARLKRAGAVILGKTGLDELAWGSTSLNPHFGEVRNPWNPALHPGDSSGGSAAAVAAGLAFAAVGTDTGCSIRQPAHCCGIVGFKPSFDRISTLGVTPLVPSMDHVGPLARNVADCALMLVAMSDDVTGELDADHVPDPTGRIDRPIVGYRVGVPRGFFFDGGSDEVCDLVEQSLGVFRALGADVVQIDLPGIDQAFEAASTMFYETRQSYAQVLQDQPELLSDDLRQRMDKVFSWQRERYEAAVAVREIFRAEMERTMSGLDLLVTPTSTVTACPVSEDDAIFARERWKNTSIFNLTGLPSISVPCGLTREGLPAGLMITGARNQDLKVLQAAFCFERAAAWHRYHPPGF